MRNTIGVVIIGVILAFAGSSPAQPLEQQKQKLTDQVTKGCDQEIKTYCQNVTPGQGRILACLYAYEDKLSTRCEYALYDASVQLERAVNAMSYVAEECRTDLQNFCSNIQPGQGRLLQCLNANSANVSNRCKQALADTGLK